MSTSDELATDGFITLDGLDLAALVASRVCHDVISPVGAIVNGLEILEDEKDEGMRAIALDLIRRSAAQASARLQFCRIAFGAAGSAAALLDLGDAEQVARGFVEDDKTKLVWEAPRQLLPKNKVKLLLNLVLVAATTIPRGGEIKVTAEGEGDATVIPPRLNRPQRARARQRVAVAFGARPGEPRRRPRHPAVLRRPRGARLELRGHDRGRGRGRAHQDDREADRRLKRDAMSGLERDPSVAVSNFDASAAALRRYEGSGSSAGT